jgi:hypothetical protein
MPAFGLAKAAISSRFTNCRPPMPRRCIKEDDIQMLIGWLLYIENNSVRKDNNLHFHWPNEGENVTTGEVVLSRIDDGPYALALCRSYDSCQYKECGKTILVYTEAGCVCVFVLGERLL